MEVKQLFCEGCGKSFDPNKARDGVVKCEYCGVDNIVSSGASDDFLNYISIGKNELDKNDFDGAYTAYDNARQLNPDLPEAYWGMALATAQVRYLKDFVLDRNQPICYGYADGKFADNDNVKRAIKCATPTQREEYKRRVTEIDAIRKKFRENQNSGTDYDCFICVKVTDDEKSAEAGEKVYTADSRDADRIYDLLRDRGFKPFYSERCIHNKTGDDYEAEILYALYKSETMLVVCRDEKYLHTPWVENEYRRFLKLAGDELKESDSLAVVFRSKPIERIPGRTGRLQGIDYSLPDASLRIVDFVEKHTPNAKARREREKQAKEREAAEIREKLERQQREFEERQNRLKKELESKMNSINVNSSGGEGPSINNLLIRARQSVEAQDFKAAKGFYETVLERVPESADAWWGLFLLEFKTISYKAVVNEYKNNPIEVRDRIEKSYNYKNAVKYDKFNAVKDFSEFKKCMSEILKNDIDVRNQQIAVETEKNQRNKREFEATQNSIEKKLSDKKQELNKLLDTVGPIKAKLDKADKELTRICDNIKGEHTKKYPISHCFDWFIWNKVAVIIFGIIAMLGLFVFLLYLNFSDKFLNYPGWLVWGCYFGNPEVTDIGNLFMAKAFNVVGCLIEGIIYGAVLGVALYVVVMLLRMFFVVIPDKIIFKIMENNYYRDCDKRDSELSKARDDSHAVTYDMKVYLEGLNLDIERIRQIIKQMESNCEKETAANEYAGKQYVNRIQILRAEKSKQESFLLMFQ